MLNCKKLVKAQTKAGSVISDNLILAWFSKALPMCGKCSKQYTCRQFKKFRKEVYNEIERRKLWPKIIGTPND